MRKIIFKPEQEKHTLNQVLRLLERCYEDNYFLDGDTNSVCVGE